MKINPTFLDGVYEIELAPRTDERGFFMRGWCAHEFKKAGLDVQFVQTNISFNHRAGTLRGLHYQEAPYQEDKLVTCLRGTIFDVALDLRLTSKTYGQWYGAELSEKNNKSLLVPKGCAHGYITLQDNSLVYYQVSEFYHPEAERGIRWDDERFAIQWPGEVREMSPKDRGIIQYATAASIL
jgi:dTDP-4-dehydrorhamnose 3,5-epimerase